MRYTKNSFMNNREKHDREREFELMLMKISEAQLKGDAMEAEQRVEAF